MPYKATITYRGGPNVLKRELKAEVKAGLAEVGDHWHGSILPGHFDRGAANKYKYKRRSRKYNERKLRRRGHKIPLVDTGQMARMVKRMARVTSTSKGARVALKGPRYLHQYRKDFGQPDKAAEIIKVTAKEAGDLARLLDEIVTKKLNDNKQRETVKIG